MAFADFGLTSNLLTRMDQSIDVYNRKIANIQFKIDALNAELASYLNTIIQMREIEEMYASGIPTGTGGGM